jgi:hypothetical protein
LYSVRKKKNVEERGEFFTKQLKFPFLLINGHVLNTGNMKGIDTRNDYIQISITKSCQRELVRALCYKPEDRGFGSLCGHCIFLLNFLNLSSRTMALAYSASNRNELQNFVDSKALPARKSDNFTCEPIV